MDLLVRNLASYSLQLGLVATAGALLPALVRLRSPRARLAYWQIVLAAAAIVLPAVQPWHAPENPRGGEVTATTLAATVQNGGRASWHIALAYWEAERRARVGWGWGSGVCGNTGGGRVPSKLPGLCAHYRSGSAFGPISTSPAKYRDR
jgi:hypothetical protein